MKTTHLASAALLLSAQLLGAQAKSVVTEASFGGGANHASGTIFTAAIGFVNPVTPRLGLGVVATAGLWDAFHLAVGPRVRFHASPSVTLDLTPALLLVRDNDKVGPLVLDASVMIGDQVGFFSQISSLRSYEYDYFNYGTPPTMTNNTVVHAGIRLGSKPGRIGIIAEAIALVSAMIVVFAVCARGDCFGLN